MPESYSANISSAHWREALDRLAADASARSLAHAAPPPPPAGRLLTTTLLAASAQGHLLFPENADTFPNFFDAVRNHTTDTGIVRGFSFLVASRLYALATFRASLLRGAGTDADAFGAAVVRALTAEDTEPTNGISVFGPAIESMAAASSYQDAPYAGMALATFGDIVTGGIVGPLLESDTVLVGSLAARAGRWEAEAVRMERAASGI